MRPASTGRMLVALGVLASLGTVAWRTMDAGKYQQLTWLLLGFFAVRIVLGWLRSRKMGNVDSEQQRDRFDM